MITATTTTLTPDDDVSTTLTADLIQARQMLVRAHVEQLRKDSPANRALVAGAQVRVDELLDLYFALA